MPLKIRKTASFAETIFFEGGKMATAPIKMGAAAAVVATGGRAHARIGNRYLDMEEIAKEAQRSA